MNLALPAVALFLFLAPGLYALRVRRANSPYAKTIRAPAQPISVEAGLGLFCATVVHAAAVTLTRFLEQQGYAPAINHRVVLGFATGKLPEGAHQAIAPYYGWIFGYAVLSIVVAWTVGFCFACLVGVLDRTGLRGIPALLGVATDKDQVINQWHDFFRYREELHAVVTFVIEMGGKPWLFIGRVKDLIFDQQTGDLDRLLLDDVCKRELDPRGEEFEAVYGEQFVVRYETLKTLNVIYMTDVAPGDLKKPGDDQGGGGK